jgi:methylenetetrahydrofolate dehydrogenase (NADP+) / methenyltetrahydrofolate cyclohydrolase
VFCKCSGILNKMKFLNGAELADFIKERQAKQVRALRQAHNVFPKLAIIICGNDVPSQKYAALKQQYGQDILVDVEIHNVPQAEAAGLIGTLNQDPAIHGIVIQLPLPDPAQTDQIVDAIAPAKDVDALSGSGTFDAATPLAINWLLTGYNIDLRGKNIVIVGQGRLVGAPLRVMLEAMGLEPVIVDENTKNPETVFADAGIIITAVGKPGLISSDMIPLNAVVVDAGVASENGVLKGDLADDAYEREDLTITPKKGGVGPLTVAALFDNVIRAADSTRTS